MRLRHACGTFPAGDLAMVSVRNRTACLDVRVAALAATALVAPWIGGYRSRQDDGPAAFLRQHGLFGRVTFTSSIFDWEPTHQGLDRMIRLHRENELAGVALVRVEDSDKTEQADRYCATRNPPRLVYRDPDTSLARSFEATACRASW